MPLNPPADITLDGGVEVRFEPAGPASDSWCRYFNIAATSPAFTPNDACAWLESRLPHPLEDHGKWFDEYDTFD